MNDFFDDDYMSAYKQKMESEWVKEAIALALKILDKVEPTWKRNVEYMKIGERVLTQVAAYTNNAHEKADATFQAAYIHWIDVNRGWRKPSRKLRLEAHEKASEAANDRYNMIMENFFSIFEQLAPYFFITNDESGSGGSGPLPNLMSNLSPLINVTNGRREK